MIQEYETVKRLGNLVKSHLHGVAVIQFFEEVDTFSTSFRYLTDALLRCSSGYTRAVIRSIIQPHTLSKDEYHQIIQQPITSPLILYVGIQSFLGLKSEDIALLEEECFSDLIVCSLVTAVVFDEMERRMKQQKVTGMNLLVKELAPSIVALLPKVTLPSEEMNKTINSLRIEGEVIIQKIREVDK